MQPSELEILREVETLRDIKRRSTVQSGVLDPDLPDVSSDSSSSSAYWDNSSSSSHGEGSDENASFADDPFHLFWVPARLHPEIAPAEFKEFLKEHARDGPALGRSNSVGVGGLGRKKSMLSRQYTPSEKDEVEDEKVVPVRRNRSVYQNQGPQLTIKDLQKLEELADEASESHDSSKLRSVLRRSLSLNISPSVIDKMDDVPDMGDDADAPIIVPRPGQILRRAARTKIRKPGTGEGPHKFQSMRSRRGSGTRSATAPGEPRTSVSDVSSSDHGDESPRRKRADSDIPELPITARPESYSEESSIYDAYAREESEESEPHTTSSFITTPEPSVQHAVTSPPPLQQQLEPEYEPSAPTPVPHQPEPERVLSPPLSEEPSTTPEPTAPPPVVAPQPIRPPLIQPTPVYQTPTPQASSPSPSDHRKEKDKKGLFGKWGSDKNSKKGHKDHKEREKEKDSGFFGSLFGGKKKQEEVVTPAAGGIGNGGREAAVALLGQSKSAKAYVPSPSPQPLQGYARYPIHVERAIYRLSHIKLANPRRPLYEQVLISNLMFWYLGVINKTQTQQPPQPAAATQAAAPTANGSADKEEEQEEREREEHEKAERERAEKEKERERAEQKRKGSLTKSPAPGTPGARRAETPVRGPQYDMQHRAMEQEYGYQSGNPPMGRTSSAPPAPMNYQPQGNRMPGGQGVTYQNAPLAQPQPQAANNRYYAPPNQAMPGQQYVQGQPGSLPPGAMPPVAVEQTWLNATSGGRSPPRATSPPSAGAGDPRRARSPPTNQGQNPRYTAAQEKQPFSGTGRMPSRSLSANATPPQNHQAQMNGKLRKGNSAHAVMPYQRTSEEEDVPLAVYQQRRK
ncbi:hypothetical protein EIP86_005577 [Pleurotus ostreatoroseus]|nr:hypothetical protein EIP86_005577 [Pleurotus ostreatoroseus]